MSGIAGLYYLDGRPVEDQALSRMVDPLAHRGPDGRGLWCEGSIGLGHQQMHTTPESLYETFPLADRAGNLMLTADARVDNREELIAQLDVPRAPRRPVTDSELILAAYETWGVACPEKLIGDFAFALWDRRAHHLFCARDHLGVRPFYYFFRPGHLVAFGSEIKALLALDGVPRAINELRVAYYLARLGDDPELTFYRDIACLPPAHSMTISRDGELRRQRYWSLDPEHVLHYDSDATYAEGFLDVFTEAVRSRTRSHRPPGVMMSGGLDSTSVACIARRVLGSTNQEPLHTFSAIFTDLPDEELRKIDERPYIEAVRALDGIDAHLIPLDDVSPLGDVDHVLWHLDAPFLICNVYLIRAMYSAARTQGVRVMLDGAEGDITVSHGTAYLQELAFAGRWDRFAHEAIALTERAGVSPHGWFRHAGKQYLAQHAQRHRWRTFMQGAHALAEPFRMPRRSLLWQYGLKPALLQPLRRARSTMRGDTQTRVPTIMAHRLTHRTNLDERVQAMTSRYTLTRHTAQEAHWLEFEAGAGSIAAILAETNHLAAERGVEARHPFFDPRVVAYCMALPPEQVLHQGWTRMVLRRAMEGILPDAICWRTDKADLSANFYRNFHRTAQPQLERLVVEDADRLAPYVDIDVLRTAHEQKNSDVLWPVLLLSQWMRQTCIGD